MARGYLVTCPDSDLAVQVGSAFYRRYIGQPALEKGIPLIILSGDEAEYNKFWESIVKEEVYIVTGVGHGNETTFTGQNKRALISVGAYDPEKIKGKCIEHTSCLTGARLLPDLAKNGAKETKGSRNVYVFYYGGNTDPTEDTYAKSFLTQEVKRYAWLLDESDRSDEEKSDSADQECFNEYMNQADKWSRIDPEVADALRYDASIMCKYRGEAPPPPPEESWICKLLKWLMRQFGCKCPQT
jgi:hypothetical protein